MKKTIIIGAGDYGQHLLAMMLDGGTAWPGLAFATEFEQANDPREEMGVIVENLHDIKHAGKPFDYIIAIQKSDARERIAGDCDDAGGRAIGFAHHSVCDFSRTLAHDREGCSIGEFVVIHPDTKIGAHTIILSHSMIGFGSRIAPFATLSHHVNALRDVRIGSHAFIGTGAVLFPGVTVGAHARIGANSTIMRDVPDHATAVGVWK